MGIHYLLVFIRWTLLFTLLLRLWRFTSSRLLLPVYKGEEWRRSFMKHCSDMANANRQRATNYSILSVWWISPLGRWHLGCSQYVTTLSSFYDTSAWLRKCAVQTLIKLQHLLFACCHNFSLSKVDLVALDTRALVSGALQRLKPLLLLCQVSLFAANQITSTVLGVAVDFSKAGFDLRVGQIWQLVHRYYLVLRAAILFYSRRLQVSKLSFLSFWGTINYISPRCFRDAVVVFRSMGRVHTTLVINRALHDKDGF